MRIQKLLNVIRLQNPDRLCQGIYFFNGILEKPQEEQSHTTDQCAVISPSKKACASSWARLIAKIYEAAPFVCPRCGSEMKILAVITDTHEVKKILKHLVKTGKAPPGVDKSMFE